MDGKTKPLSQESFLRRTVRPAEGFLAEMEALARERNIPVILPETAAMLRFLVTSVRPVRILEIGTAIGYSAGVMACCQGPEGHIDTIEVNEDRAGEAESNLAELGLSARVRVLRGDARVILPCLSTLYDMVFVDAAKGQYPEYLDECFRLINPGGILITDNVLFMGLPASDGPIAHKHRTIAVRLRQYLTSLCRNEEFVTAILPLGDGLAVSCRKIRTTHA